MEECDLTQEELGDRMKKDRSTVTNYLRLLKLPPDIQKSVREAEISMGHARALIGLEEIDKQLYAFREVRNKAMSVRQTEQLVRQLSFDKPAATPKTDTAKSKLPPAFKRIEDNMASHFSTRVRLDRKGTGKGAVVIEFYTDEDLERIMDKMNL